MKSKIIKCITEKTDKVKVNWQSIGHDDYLGVDFKIIECSNGRYINIRRKYSIFK